MFILGFFLGFIVAMIAFNFGKLTDIEGLLPESPRSWKLISAEKCRKDSFYTILTVETRSGKRKFRGSCTVWNDLETFIRCSISEESVLANFLEKAKYKGMIDG